MKYQETHPWIQFPPMPPINTAYAPLWYLMGEVSSKIAHLSASAVSPRIHEELNRFYLIRGVQGSTAIEGNTLSEKEIEQILDNKEPLPPSKRYLEQEIRNVLDASNQIVQDVCIKNGHPLSPEYICSLNTMVLNNLELQEDVQPGSFRTHSVVVGTVYRGAPPEDCAHLMQQLCNWLNSPVFESPTKEMQPAMAIIQATCAHIYLAWIHPFGDGNGRTARLIELYLLLKAGLPVPAAHLLSNHYNKTRTEYYIHLQKLSKKNVYGKYPGFDDFLTYALQGMVDGLKEQLDKIQCFQLNIMWNYHVYEQFRAYGKKDQTSKSRERQGKRMRDLLLSLQENWQSIDFNTIPTDVFHTHYSTKTARTLQRDIRELVDMGLLEKSEHGYKPRKDIVIAMLPLKAN